MGTAYYDPRSVGLRLDRTICMYKGEPVYVELDHDAGRNDIEGWHRLKMWPLDGRMNKSTSVDYREPEFDYRAFPLGYMNNNGQAYYLSRTPGRIQKQGLAKEAVSFLPNYPDHGPWYNHPCMRDCILGVHPTLQEAYASLVNGGALSQSFHRDLCLAFRAGGSYMLEYKGRAIGYLHTNTPFTFHLYESRDKKVLAKVLTSKEIGLCIANT